MKINLHELEHIKIALYRLKKDSTLSDKYKYEIDNLYKQVSKFLVIEQEKVKVNIEVKEDLWEINMDCL